LTRHLTVFARAGCHLCDDMMLELERLKPALGFEYSIRDVDADPALASRYGARVPVLVAGDTELCCYFLDERSLREYCLPS
jgi:thioredoxin reductase (NADPH)